MQQLPSLLRKFSVICAKQQSQRALQGTEEWVQGKCGGKKQQQLELGKPWQFSEEETLLKNELISREDRGNHSSWERKKKKTAKMFLRLCIVRHCFKTKVPNPVP